MGEKLYGHGFDPDACEGCPHHTFYEQDDDDAGLIQRVGNLVAGNENGYWGCGICGCPTEEGMLLDRFGSPPANCPRLDQHEGK